MPLRIAKHKKQSLSHFHSREQERSHLNRNGAKLVPRSGAGDIKGDVRVKGKLRLECKTTNKDSFRVTREMIQKIEDAALGSAELPVIEVEFVDQWGKPQSKVCVVPAWVIDLICQ